MGLIFWLLIGFAAGAIAKMLTPQEEKGGWVSSIIIGIVGSFVGRIVAGFVGIASSGLIGSLLIATGGAVLVLFIYHRYLADKLNLPI
ncbi:MAG: GlsB/YeaQ/YmgE family stress response membrane protein [Lewinellaceae bacterium]|nr:GlsB/YeaQ/YmgE family stress response membrane protein [Phaeodactylibacter sp.]MCB0612031.1 GlsB/YeaQ/YmgE family stress response membrane protein [Phaeodactylibacter sp.]MCB9348743.1 GlsB/YeaQ/YmgE family stress response membrane protein [Lewinellaceae bacterium]